MEKEKCGKLGAFTREVGEIGQYYFTYNYQD